MGGVTNSSSGLLEVCGNGRWGTVCDYRNEWNYENVMVVCRQLNLPTASKCNKQLVFSVVANSPNFLLLSRC